MVLLQTLGSGGGSRQALQVLPPSGSAESSGDWSLVVPVGPRPIAAMASDVVGGKIGAVQGAVTTIDSVWGGDGSVRNTTAVSVRAANASSISDLLMSIVNNVSILNQAEGIWGERGVQGQVAARVDTVGYTALGRRAQLLRALGRPHLPALGTSNVSESLNVSITGEPMLMGLYSSTGARPGKDCRWPDAGAPRADQDVLPVLGDSLKCPAVHPLPGIRGEVEACGPRARAKVTVCAGAVLRMGGLDPIEEPVDGRIESPTAAMVARTAGGRDNIGASHAISWLPRDINLTMLFGAS